MFQGIYLRHISVYVLLLFHYLLLFLILTEHSNVELKSQECKTNHAIIRFKLGSKVHVQSTN